MTASQQKLHLEIQRRRTDFAIGMAQAYGAATSADSPYDKALEAFAKEAMESRETELAMEQALIELAEAESAKTEAPRDQS